MIRDELALFEFPQTNDQTLRVYVNPGDAELVTPRDDERERYRMAPAELIVARRQGQTFHDVDVLRHPESLIEFVNLRKVSEKKLEHAVRAFTVKWGFLSSLHAPNRYPLRLWHVQAMEFGFWLDVGLAWRAGDLPGLMEKYPNAHGYDVGKAIDLFAYRLHAAGRPEPKSIDWLNESWWKGEARRCFGDAWLLDLAPFSAALWFTNQAGLGSIDADDVSNPVLTLRPELSGPIGEQVLTFRLFTQSLLAGLAWHILRLFANRGEGRGRITVCRECSDIFLARKGVLRCKKCGDKVRQRRFRSRQLGQEV